MTIFRTRRRAFVAGLLLAAVAAAPALAQGTLEKAKADGYIRVGFANEAPYGVATPAGQLTGEAPEVAKAVLAKLGIAQVDGVLPACT
jgi:polar amino acid transport system substrate-binding protein